MSCRRITYVVPARYFLIALRGIVLKGVGLAIVWHASSLALVDLRDRRADAGVGAAAAAVELSMRRIRFLVWKELIELRQDPRLFGIVIMAPIIQLFAARLRGDDRRPQRAGGRRRRRSIGRRAAS